MESGFPVLSFLVFGPVAGALALALVPAAQVRLQRAVALATTLAVLAVALQLWTGFVPRGGFQFEERLSWIPAIGAEYHLGVDGLSLLLVLLSALLGPVVVLFSMEHVRQRERAYYAALLMLQAGLTGVFVALDFVLFYIFWEAMLIPMFLLIGIWGGPRRIYASVKFFLYTLVGSLLMLAAAIAVYWHHGSRTGVYTFDIVQLAQTSYPGSLQFWAFLGFFAAFAVKVPLVPVHTWLPDAHVEAPTAGSVVLAGVLLKMGTYGLMRFSLPLFPDASRELAPFVLTLAVIGIIYGAVLALAQDDLKKLIAYSSISHLGFVVAGIFSFDPRGEAGAVLQMIGHGLITGALFLCVGMVYERTHQRSIPKLGGLAHRLPVYATLLAFFALASLGLPGLAGFVGEFLILIGVFAASPAFAVGTAVGIVLGAAYLLWMLQRVIFGTLPEQYAGLGDLTALELLALAPLVALTIWIGVAPRPFLAVIESALPALLSRAWQ
ncbi:MAG TPA: NADH-quinone oxidoreductase subunit M [bacterium]